MKRLIVSAVFLMFVATFSVFAQTNNLLPKNEYHVTLLGGKASSFISEKIKKLPNADETVFRERVERLMREFSWNFEYTNTYYYLRREYNDPDPVDVNKTIPEIRETIIQLVDVPDLRVLHQSLEELCGMENEIEALPHITIFSNSTREDKKQRGIGIYSEEDLNISNAQKI